MIKIGHRLWALVCKHPFLSGFLALEIGASLIGETKTIAKYFGVPFAFVGVNMAPEDTIADWFKVLYWVLCSLIYFAIWSSCVRLCKTIFYKKEPDVSQKIPSLELYSSEIATAVEVIDRDGSTDRDTENAVEDFLSHVGDTILDTFKEIPLRKLRHAFIMGEEKENDSGDIIVKFSMVRLGNRRTLQHHDLEAVKWVFENVREAHYLSGDLRNFVPNHDMEAIGLVRNNVGRLIFGFVIFIPKKDVLTDETSASFYNATQAITLIPYMDKLMNIMVKYSIKLEGR